METQTAIRANGGLEGVIAAETRLSMVDGERGELIVAGHRLEQLAGRPFEEVVALLWDAAGQSGARVRAASRCRRRRSRCCATLPGAASRRWTRCAWPPAR